MDFIPTEKVGCEQLPLPVYVNGSLPPCPTMAPEQGANTDEVLASVALSADVVRRGGATNPSRPAPSAPLDGDVDVPSATALAVSSGTDPR